MTRLVWTLTLENGERRTLRQGIVTIGRDQAADWTIDDPAHKLSRAHCQIEACSEGLVVRDLSANGTFLNDCAKPIGTDTKVALGDGDRLGLGGHVLLIGSLAVPLRQPGVQRGESEILDAFCLGAGLDPSVFAARDTLDVMGDLGAIYRELLTGLGNLMKTRAAARADLAMDGTTLQAGGNNPFKWAGPESLARDLLDSQPGGYLDGATAVKASFEDLSAHHDALAAGLLAGIRLTLDAVDPARLETAVPGAALLGGHRRAWRHFRETHATAADVRGVMRLAGAAYAGQPLGASSPTPARPQAGSISPSR